MKPLIILLETFLFLGIIADAQTTFPAWKGRWTERQTETGGTEWLFQGNDHSAKIRYWGAAELGGKIHKGTFHIDTLNKMVLLKFDKVIDIKNDTVLRTGHHEE